MRLPGPAPFWSGCFQAQDVGDDVAGFRRREDQVRHGLVGRAQEHPRADRGDRRVVGHVLERRRARRGDAPVHRLDIVTRDADRVREPPAFDRVSRQRVVGRRAGAVDAIQARPSKRGHPSEAIQARRNRGGKRIRVEARRFIFASDRRQNSPRTRVLESTTPASRTGAKKRVPGPLGAEGSTRSKMFWKRTNYRYNARHGQGGAERQERIDRVDRACGRRRLRRVQP